MHDLIAIVAGCLFGAGLYLILRRTLAQLILGLALLSNAVNLLIFAAARPGRDAPPLVPDGAQALAAGSADPVPQALILTAIVISFGVIAFFVVLVHRAYEVTGTDDLDRLTSTDRLSYVEPRAPGAPDPPAASALGRPKPLQGSVEAASE